MTSPKTIVQWGAAAKIESVYGTINAPTVADGVLLKQAPVPDVPHWLNTGDRGVTPGGGKRQDAPSSGRWGGFKWVAEGIGAGAAYAAGVKPHLDVPILASGFTGTGGFTGGQEFWQYTPATQPTALTSITADTNVAGQLYRLYGGYSDLDIAASGPVIPDWGFDIAGALDFITDAAIPAYNNYPAISNVPMKSDAITLKIGLFTAGVVKQWSLKMNRNFKNNRVNQAGGFTTGFSGFTPGYRHPQLEVVVERVALATVTPWNTATTLNPYRMAEDSNPVLLQVSVGATQYKRWHVYSGTGLTAGAPNPAAQAVLQDVKDTAEGPTATWTLVFDLFPSTYGASDDLSILYN